MIHNILRESLVKIMLWNFKIKKLGKKLRELILDMVESRNGDKIGLYV